MKHLTHLSSDNPAQDVSQARSDGKLHLLLAASGSVATIKIPNIIQGLSRHSNLSIRLVLTSSAAQFLQGQAAEQPTLEEIRSYPNVDAIYTDESEWVQPWTRGAPILHIELRKCKFAAGPSLQERQTQVIAPLSANTLAKMVHGMTDSLLSSIILAWDTDGGVDGKKKKILVATAMNTAMFRNPITQRNLQLLNEVMGGPGGWVEELQTISKGLACGDVGQGAMASWQTIVAAIEEKLGLPTEESKEAE
ncbi:putative phosphopantothenoylcysteine decarboxylase [Trichoderma ghanense]|uniref:Phosphopantothenoylcysteine decarboxylase n=1 Tax=Trichoderma ghanense TaxID=65468 RepID=A0ABY2HH33_9HYPO